MTDTHEARVEAAAQVMYDEFAGLVADAWESEALYEQRYWLTHARAALAAADEAVTVADIERAIMGRTATAGAKAVQRLYRGEEQS